MLSVLEGPIRILTMALEEDRGEAASLAVLGHRLAHTVAGPTMVSEI
jgi:hypothetical protein